VKNGGTKSARLIRVGIDIPAVWEIEDALQEVTADLYINFTWEVKAERETIWDNATRSFRKPVWRVRVTKGKLISNLKDATVLADELCCGDEKKGLTTIIQRITITAKFSQKFDLRRFPFDKQKVGFQIRYWFMPYSQPSDGEKSGRLIFYEDITWNCRVKKNALKPSDE